MGTISMVMMMMMHLVCWVLSAMFIVSVAQQQPSDKVGIAAPGLVADVTNTPLANAGDSLLLPESEKKRKEKLPDMMGDHGRGGYANKPHHHHNRKGACYEDHYKGHRRGPGGDHRWDRRNSMPTVRPQDMRMAYAEGAGGGGPVPIGIGPDFLCTKQGECWRYRVVFEEMYNGPQGLSREYGFDGNLLDLYEYDGYRPDVYEYDGYGPSGYRPDRYGPNGYGNDDYGPSGRRYSR